MKTSISLISGDYYWEPLKYTFSQRWDHYISMAIKHGKTPAKLFIAEEVTLKECL